VIRYLHKSFPVVLLLICALLGACALKEQTAKVERIRRSVGNIMRSDVSERGMEL